MLALRRRPLPALPQALVPLYRQPPVVPPERTVRLWPALVGLGVGVVLGLWGTPRPLAAPAHLTPQQQQIYGLVQDLAQTANQDQAWKVQTQLYKLVRTLHPQPLPSPDAILPHEPGWVEAGTKGTAGRPTLP